MGLDADFLDMLQMPIVVTPFTGEDSVGNSTYGTPYDAVAAISSDANSFGTDDGQNKMEGVTVNQVSFLCDAIGIKLRDKITLPAGTLVYVTNADTGHDEDGSDLYQTITAESAQKG